MLISTIMIKRAPTRRSCKPVLVFVVVILFDDILLQISILPRINKFYNYNNNNYESCEYVVENNGWKVCIITNGYEQYVPPNV